MSYRFNSRIAFSARIPILLGARFSAFCSLDREATGFFLLLRGFLGEFRYSHRDNRRRSPDIRGRQRHEETETMLFRAATPLRASCDRAYVRKKFHREKVSSCQGTTSRQIFIRFRTGHAEQSSEHIRCRIYFKTVKRKEQPVPHSGRSPLFTASRTAFTRPVGSFPLICPLFHRRTGGTERLRQNFKLFRFRPVNACRWRSSRIFMLIRFSPFFRWILPDF